MRRSFKITNGDVFIISDPDLMYTYAVHKSSKVVNLKTNNTIKPSKDKRRPMEPPMIYLNKRGGGRVCIYHDKLIAMCFHEDFDNDHVIFHKDGDITNSAYDNLLILKGSEILTEYYHDTKMWEPVNIPDVKLYYNYYICEDGRLLNASTGAIIKPFEDPRKRNHGYLRYNLYTSKSSKDVIHYSASRLVAEHFMHCHPEDKPLILFIDRDHSNLHYTNLQWGDVWDKCNQEYSMSERDEMREFSSLKDNVLGKEKWETFGPEQGFAYEYKVSNFGRVYNATKKFYCNQCKRDKNLNNQSHLAVGIKTIKDGYRTIGVHILVAMAFCENDDPTNKIFVNHINGNPECNLAMNLEWSTPSENARHAINTNLKMTKMYTTKCDETYWRLNTILAWLFAFKAIDNNKRYNMYLNYFNTYKDNIPELSYDEFISAFEDKLKNDVDFKTIYNFYMENYNISIVH